jgi:hypothetical protein
MDFAKIYEENFLNYISIPLSKLIEEHNRDLGSFKDKLNRIQFKLIGQSRQYFEKLIKPHPELCNMAFRDMVKKTNYTMENLFDKVPEGLLYINGKTKMFIDPPSSIESHFALTIYDHCSKSLELMEERISDVNEVQEILRKRSFLTHTEIVKRERKPKRQSFQLVNPDVNLQYVHKILCDGRFIDNGTSVSNFLQVFSGDPVGRKVIWENANALQYFIHGVIEKGGVIRPNEGKWVRTIKCFKLPNRELKVSDLKNTKPPVAARTADLDLAIEVICRK